MPPEKSIRPQATEEPYFDELADLYERFIRVLDSDYSPVRRWLVEQLPGGARALDVGCGAGRNCVLLADRGYGEILGVDIAEQMLAIARDKRTRPNIRYEHRSVFDLAVEQDGQFDVVMSVNSVFHMGPVDKVLGHMRQLVAPGGRLVIIDVVLADEWDVSGQGWQVEYAFNTARMVFFVSRQADAAADTLRLMLHPRWLEMTRTNVPLNRGDFLREYTTALPGVKIDEGLNPTLCGVVWQAPGRES
jgi:ubiquinone/menaquinone biosynthesis C-methylase UbiE